MKTALISPQHPAYSPQITQQKTVFTAPSVDTVRFSGAHENPRDQLKIYAEQLLTKTKPKADQNLIIKLDPKFMPLAEEIAKIAYKKYNTGYLVLQKSEPELEALKQKYGKDKFKSAADKQINKDLASGKATRIVIPDNAYTKAGLKSNQIEKLVASTRPGDKALKNARNYDQIDTRAIFDPILNMKQNQPLIIKAKREHMPVLKKLAEVAYKKYNSPWVQFDIEELGMENIFIENRTEKQLKNDYWNPYRQVRDQQVKAENAARIWLYDKDPEVNEMPGGNNSKAQAYRTISNSSLVIPRLTFPVPHAIIYWPTQASATKAGYTDDFWKGSALKQAVNDAKKINTIEQLEKLETIKTKLTGLLAKGYDTLHFKSADGTDLTVGLSKEQSLFGTAKMKTTKGQKFIANVPSHEVFSVPVKSKVNGTVKITRPFIHGGQKFENITLRFKNGKATSNNTQLDKLLKNTEGMDYLGEVALVANSPIFKTERLFFNTLLDENAACHIALGASVPSGISDGEPGTLFNISKDHKDIMIGGPGVSVSIQKSDEPKAEAIPIINDKNQFVLQ